MEEDNQLGGYAHLELAHSLAHAIGGRVRQLRRRRGWSTYDLGGRPGLSEPNVRKIESSSPSKLRLDTLAALMLAFDLPSLDLLVGPSPGATSDLVEKQWGLQQLPPG